MFDKLANALGVGFNKLKNALGLEEERMVFPTTSQDLSRSTQIAQQEQAKGYYKGIDTSPLKSQLLGELKSSVGLNYEDAQVAAYQRGMQTGNPQMAALMGNKPALSDVDFTGGLKNASGAVSRAFSSQVGKSISKNIEQPKLSQIEAKGEILNPKNFKTAEDYVKAQGTPVYHGTSVDFDKFDPGIKKDDYGTLFTLFKEDVTSNKNLPIIKERIVDKKIKLISIDELGKLENSTEFLNSPKQTWELLTEKGYKGIDYQDGTIQLFNPEKDTFKQSQLTDIWNKAHNNLPGFSTKEALITGGILSSLTVGGLILANALGIKPKDNLQSSLDMPEQAEKEPVKYDAYNLKKAIITFYNNEEKQTDKDPDIGGFGTKMEFGDIAIGNRVSEYFPARAKFRKGIETYAVIPELYHIKTPHGQGVFRVRDTMAEKFDGQNKVDIFIPKEMKEMKEMEMLIRKTPIGNYALYSE